MFNVGDKIVCINNLNDIHGKFLSIGKVYNVKFTFQDGDIVLKEFYDIWFKNHNFISLIKMRNNKILKIKEIINENRRNTESKTVY